LATPLRPAAAAMAQQGQQIAPELADFIQREKTKVAFNALVSQLADVCFDKCVTQPGSKLSYSEESCLSHCAMRYIDMQQAVVERLQSSPGS